MADFEKLLKDLTLRVGEDDAAQIRALLEQVVATTQVKNSSSDSSIGRCA